MNPIKVLLVHRDSDIYRRLTGWWSYGVPEFQWTTLKVPRDGFSVDMRQYTRGIDLVVLDDWVFGTLNNLHIPLAYVIVDSMRSAEQLRRNYDQAKQADLILVDSDKLSAFSGLGKAVQRFAYAVNEHLFYPREKVYDVAFLCWPTDERRMVQEWCRDICARHHWCFITGTYDWNDYARFISSSKVVVHKPHVPQGRSWRVFDVMAARGCLLSEMLPDVSGDGLRRGEHYHEYRDRESLEAALESLLDGDFWKPIAEAGYQHVMQNHTWRIRAEQLRGMLTDIFKHDAEKMML
jgi:glycosyltransferase involved in cell wall biosynthesis